MESLPTESEINLPESKGLKISKGLDGSYDPKEVEEDWQNWWEENNFFHGDAESTKKRFTILIPPPNVTGTLHVGHTLFVALQDAMLRWRRMLGYESEWIPGTDHAGIATQTVVEKNLFRETGQTRHDIGREEFVKLVWKWREQNGDAILNQFKRLGASIDSKRTFFTLDPPRVKGVCEAFCRLYEKGYIYRDTRIVNWCCFLKTALSDIEVDHIEIKKPEKRQVLGHDGFYEFGYLVHFAYKIKGIEVSEEDVAKAAAEDKSKESEEKEEEEKKDGKKKDVKKILKIKAALPDEIIVATTRIETMLADTAVAVHPDDERYKHLIGKELIHPFFPERKMKIIGDPVLVEMGFGTGAVKITPAHDMNDFECGRRNGLEEINIFNDDGVINENGGRFKGIKRFDARKIVSDELDKLGLLKGKQANDMSIAVCSRSGDVIEPLVKPQWWMNCEQLAQRSIDAVKEKELKIIPSNFEKTWYEWLSKIRPWCISRQLWWGHRIPAYLVKIEGKIDQPDSKNPEHWLIARTQEDAFIQAKEKYGEQYSDKIELIQDPDVLDTWFSSGLMPFTSLGWPEQTQDLNAFFPSDVLETGTDILFFWVARMVMMSLCLMEKLPFHTVFLHHLIKDAHGKKMSKSSGNIIDPIEVIEGCTLDSLLNKIEQSTLPAKEKERGFKLQKKEFPKGIPECGNDGLRFGLLAYMSQGRNINLDILRVVGYRHFCNKLWNAVKFALLYIPRDFSPISDLEEIFELRLTFCDRWILSKLFRLIEQINQDFENYKFGDMISKLHHFWLHEFCDVYLEACKPTLQSDSPSGEACKQTLYICISVGLRLLHPSMPFVTEELFQHLPSAHSYHKSCSITKSAFPTHTETMTGLESMPENKAETLDMNMEMIMDIVKTIRSVIVNLNLVKEKPESIISLQEQNEEQLAFLNTNAYAIQCLSKIGPVHAFFEKDVQEIQRKECIVCSKGKFITVFLKVKGLIDVNKEVQRLDKKGKKVESAIANLEKKMKTKDYETKVPADVREFNQKKNDDLVFEMTEIQKCIDEIKAMN